MAQHALNQELLRRSIEHLIANPPPLDLSFAGLFARPAPGPQGLYGLSVRIITRAEFEADAAFLRSVGIAPATKPRAT